MGQKSVFMGHGHRGLSPLMRGMWLATKLPEKRGPDERHADAVGMRKLPGQVERRRVLRPRLLDIPLKPQCHRRPVPARHPHVTAVEGNHIAVLLTIV